MYRAIVARVLRHTWGQIATDGPGAAVAKAHPELRFTFVGDTALGASLVGREAFAAWFDSVYTVPAPPPFATSW